MVPYVRKSFYKHFKDAVKYLDEESKGPYLLAVKPETPMNEYPVGPGNKLYDYALDMTNRELYQAVEGMYHKLNTLQSRSGNQ